MVLIGIRPAATVALVLAALFFARGIRAGQSDGLEDALQLIESAEARSRILEDLRSEDGERVTRGLAALVGWVRWDRFDHPPDVEVTHSLDRPALAKVMMAVLARGHAGETRQQVRLFIARWSIRAVALELGPELAGWLHDPDEEIRREALAALGMMRLPEFEDAIAGSLDDPELPVREQAACALVQLHSVRHARSMVRVGAAQASTRLARDMGGRPEVYPPMIPAWLHDEDPRVRTGAVWLLDQWGTGSAWCPELLPLLGDEPDVAERAVALLRRSLTNPDHPALRAFLRDPRPAARLRAVRLVGELQVSDTAGELAALLDEAHPGLTVAALEALGALAAAEHAGRALELLTARADSIRAAAADALGKMMSIRSVDFVASLLDDPAPRVRGRAALALARLGDARAGPTLAAVLEGRAPDLWVEPAHALLLLNALRRPEAWQRLRGTRRDEIWADVSALTVLETAAKAAGLTLRMDALPEDRARSTRWTLLLPGTHADLLEQMRYWGDGAVVVEDHELRVLTPQDAAAFWSHWLADEGEGSGD